MQPATQPLREFSHKKRVKILIEIFYGVPTFRSVKNLLSLAREAGQKVEGPR